MVEIADDCGAMLDPIQVTEPRLKPIAKHSASAGRGLAGCKCGCGAGLVAGAKVVAAS